MATQIHANFEVWLERNIKRSVPSDAMSRMRSIVRDLAQGASERFWSEGFLTYTIPTFSYVNDELVHVGNMAAGGVFNIDSDTSKMFQQGKYVILKTLEEFDLAARISNGPSYLVIVEGYRLIRLLNEKYNFSVPPKYLFEVNQYITDRGRLTKEAFELAEQISQDSVFISYKRKESSAFALLVLSRLKHAGLDVFLDLAMEPGDDWKDVIKKRLQNCDVFVLILSKNTLKSSIVLDEITWALEANRPIIPIWHNGFRYKSALWKDIPTQIHGLLDSTHTIRVLEESALAYNNAVVELLNRFGITPD